jgi:hypothetical protein
MPQVICTFLSAEAWTVRPGTALVSMSAGGCDQTVEGFDLPVEHFDDFLPPAPGAFRYRLASLYRLVKLIEVGTTNLVGLLRQGRNKRGYAAPKSDSVRTEVSSE